MDILLEYHIIHFNALETLFVSAYVCVDKKNKKRKEFISRGKLIVAVTKDHELLIQVSRRRYAHLCLCLYIAICTFHM